MIISFDIKVEDIASAGKSFKWPVCPCEKCNRNMWGHGFVGRYFEGFIQLIGLKRWRCPCCGAVALGRPKSFFPRFRSSIKEIYDSLITKLKTKAWPKGFRRQRGWYWLKLLKKSLFMQDRHRDPTDFLIGRFESGVNFFV